MSADAPWPRAAARGACSADPRALPWQPAYDTRGGQGIPVALVDTGLDWTAPVLRGRALDYVDLLGGGGAPRDPGGHGTRGAALLLGAAPDGAPALAGNISLTVFGAVGGGTRAVARALRGATARKARLVALPFGRLLPDDAVRDALAELLASGAEVLAAAGNRGAEVVLFPAAMRGVRAVSGLGPDGAVLPECPGGAAVALLAPGVVRCPWDGRAMHGSSAAVVMAVGLRALALDGIAPAALEGALLPQTPPAGD